MRDGSTSRNSTVWQPWNSPTIAQPEPPMWNIGMTAKFTESGVNRHDSVTFMTPLKKLSLVSITPFGNPVVPDVYSWNATSAPAACTPGSLGALAASSASYSSQRG